MRESIKSFKQGSAAEAAAALALIPSQNSSSGRRRGLRLLRRCKYEILMMMMS